MIEWLRRLSGSATERRGVATVEAGVSSAGQAYVEQRAHAQRDRLLQALIDASDRFQKKYGVQQGTAPAQQNRVPVAPCDRAKAAYSAFIRSGVIVLRGPVDRYRAVERAQEKTAQSRTARQRLTFAARIAPLPNVLRHPATSNERICAPRVPQPPAQTEAMGEQRETAGRRKDVSDHE